VQEQASRSLGNFTAELWSCQEHLSYRVSSLQLNQPQPHMESVDDESAGVLLAETCRALLIDFLLDSVASPSAYYRHVLPIALTCSVCDSADNGRLTHLFLWVMRVYLYVRQYDIYDILPIHRCTLSNTIFTTVVGFPLAA